MSASAGAAVALSHHEVLALAAPFVRAGWRVDLAGSRRDEAHVRFVPSSPAPGDGSGAAPGDAPALRLDLHVQPGGGIVLVRTAWSGEPSAPASVPATTTARGRDPAALLAAVAGVPPARHFDARVPGAVVARDYTVAHAGAEPALAEGRVRCDGLELRLRVPPVRRVAGEVAIAATAAGERPVVPEDFLAVLGWNWARLVKPRPGQAEWTSRLRLRGDATERTAKGEAALALAARHLAQSAAEAPGAWHARHRTARLAVFLRRGIPTWNAIALVLIVLASARWRDAISGSAWVLLYHVPTLLVAASFMLQELPRFEIPPWPRRLRSAGWVSPAG